MIVDTGHTFKLSKEQLNTAMAAMAVTLLFNSVQRPGAVMAATLDEYERATKHGEV